MVANSETNYNCVAMMIGSNGIPYEETILSYATRAQATRMGIAYSNHCESGSKICVGYYIDKAKRPRRNYVFHAAHGNHFILTSKGYAQLNECAKKSKEVGQSMGTKVLNTWIASGYVKEVPFSSL